MTENVASHDQKVTHSYTIRYPDHAPRTDDPHYAAFETFKRKKQGTADWVCAMGKRYSDYSHCSLDQPLEIHHRILEFAVANEVELSLLEIDYPSVQTPEELEAFVESDENFEILCVFHHRMHGGKHTLSYADFVASEYIKGLTS